MEEEDWDLRLCVDDGGSNEARGRKFILCNSSSRDILHNLLCSSSVNCRATSTGCRRISVRESNLMLIPIGNSGSGGQSQKVVVSSAVVLN